MNNKKIVVALVVLGAAILLASGALIWLGISRSARQDQAAAPEPPAVELPLLATKVPTVNFYDARQSISTAESEDTDWLRENGVTMVALEDLDPTRKVLDIDGTHPLEQLQGHEEILTLTQTGVTALARKMIWKLNTAAAGNPLYFSDQIGWMLREADITHTSNEVSFTDNCQYINSSVMQFCSPWPMLEAITDTGIDLIELTGNHNNDYGTAANTATIEKYHELGLATVGGGLNAAEAAKPYSVEQKGSKVVLLAYNAADGPGSGPIAGANKPGANRYSAERAQAEIAAAKDTGAFVIVDLQYYECYAYPASGQEMPSCDAPIQGQQKLFREVAAMGADMVVGTSAHQPQTFELYNGVPIYYGLGNLWFDQDRWPGTSRGLVLTHYFYQGKLLTTRLRPTIYDADLQVELMDFKAATDFLARLGRSRPSDADELTSSQSLQQLVDNWAKGKDVAVALYNLDRERLVAERNAEKKYFSASLYKLRVVNSGYMAVQTGEKALDAPLVGGKTWGECLDAAIRTSDSPCAETLRANLPDCAASLSLSAMDMLADLLWTWRGNPQGQSLNAENRAKLLDSMLNQPELYRRGLPSGFGDDVKVYDKVGWNVQQEWHDAAIIEIAGRHYAIVVMTNGVVPGAMGWSAVRDLGQQLDQALRS